MDRLRKLLFVFALGCICLVNACASTIGAGQGRAEKITQEIETAAGLVERSNMADTEKRRVVNALRNVVPQVTQLGKDVDHNKAIADSHVEAAKKWRVIKWLFVGAVAIGCVFFARRFLKI